MSLAVPARGVLGVIGPNGAGKSTLFHLISGHLRPDTGTLHFAGRDITRLPPQERARLGIAIAFQAVRLFRGMSVIENVMVGAQAWTAHGFWEAALRLPRQAREEPQIRDAARGALERVGLTRWSDKDAESLPVGSQRSLQVARAICARPRLLLLDEPASGLRGEERERLATLIFALAAEGLPMLLIEHDVAFVMRLAQQLMVMDRGRVIAQGAPAVVRNDPVVIAAYLGEERPGA